MTAIELAADLTAKGSPFVLATVVRCDKPTSAKPGQKAVVLPDGTMHGWVGGSCAQPLVTREALLALADGQPRLLRLCPTAGDGTTLPGLVEHRMACHSGGTLEIFVEPILPKPALCIVGDSPIAQVLAGLGPVVGFAVVHVDAATAGVGGRIDAALAGDAGPRAYVIVATMGEADEESLVAALRSPAPYVALVASPKRAAKVREFLAEEGLPADRLSKLHAPAGLDLGGPTAEEIALSVMAEIVQVRAGAPSLARVTPLADAHPAATAPPAEAVDPVCGMTVAVAGARFTAEHAGQLFYFCCPGCRRSFEKQPERYLTRTA